MSQVIEDYVAYVQDKINEFKKSSELIDMVQNQVTPEKINRNLAVYTSVNGALNAEYQRKKAELSLIKRQYQRWFDEKYSHIKTQMYQGRPQSFKVSGSEIESELRFKFDPEYQEWQDKLLATELASDFILRLLDQWKTHSQIIIALSHNIRQELFSLSLDGRVNSEKLVTKRPSAGIS